MKKIIVCVKEVPNTDKIQIDYEKGILKRESTQTIINPPDETALYWALKLKKDYGFHTCVISMGPKKTFDTIQYILSTGIDEGYLISDPAFSGSDTLTTSRILASAIQYLKGADLIFFGSHSLDGDTGQVPGQVAEILQIPSFSSISEISLNSSDFVLLTKKTESVQNITSPIPLAVSFIENKAACIPLPTAKSYFKVNQIPTISNKILNIPVELIGLKGSPTQVIKITTPKFNKIQEIDIYDQKMIEKLLNKIEIFKKT